MSGRQARQRRRQQRIKLPDGTSAALPDPDDPTWDAYDRIRTGTPQPGDAVAALSALAAADPGWLLYAAQLARMPRNTADYIKGPSGRVDIRTGAREKILARLAGLAETGELGMCVHVRHLAPRPAMWVAWAPRKLRCHACTETVGQRMAGTREDWRCDACGHHCGGRGARISKFSQLIPPAPYKQVVVPILVFFGLCNRCAGPEAIQFYEGAGS